MFVSVLQYLIFAFILTSSNDKASQLQEHNVISK